MSEDSIQPGVVFLIGAGPGDPGLLTLHGAELIRRADAVVYDALANPALLELARADAERIDVGKRAKHHKLSQEQINELLAELALAGKNVARLKGGDPYVFGRGSEEAIYLHERGVAVRVVPGITAGIAGPSYAGVPVTHRQIATTCTFITGHEDPTKDASQTDYAALAELAKSGGTLCFYMGMGRLGVIAEQLTGNGLDGQTPAAVVQWGTHPRQRSLRSTLSAVKEKAEQSGLGAPAIVVIGPVAGLDEQALNWFERLPLFGRTIAITRTRQQASDLRLRLEELGAAVIEAPTIAIVPPEDWTPILDAVRNIAGYDWLVLTSVNGVSALGEVMAKLNVDARHLGGVKLAAIGEATAMALRQQLGLCADLVPTDFVAESLAAELIAQHDVAGKRFLMLRADIARPALREKLTEAGARVEDLPVYRTKPAEALPEALIEALQQKRVDWITFTSSSTVRHFLELLGDRRGLLEGVKLASIGPVTSQTVRELGLTVALEAERHDIAGLVEALVG